MPGTFIHAKNWKPGTMTLSVFLKELLSRMGFMILPKTSDTSRLEPVMIRVSLPATAFVTGGTSLENMIIPTQPLYLFFAMVAGVIAPDIIFSKKTFRRWLMKSGLKSASPIIQLIVQNGILSNTVSSRMWPEPVKEWYLLLWSWSKNWWRKRTPKRVSKLSCMWLTRLMKRDENMPLISKKTCALFLMISCQIGTIVPFLH